MYSETRLFNRFNKEKLDDTIGNGFITVNVMPGTQFTYWHDGTGITEYEIPRAQIKTTDDFKKITITGSKKYKGEVINLVTNDDNTNYLNNNYHFEK